MNPSGSDYREPDTVNCWLAGKREELCPVGNKMSKAALYQPDPVSGLLYDLFPDACDLVPEVGAG